VQMLRRTPVLALLAIAGGATGSDQGAALQPTVPAQLDKTPPNLEPSSSKTESPKAQAAVDDNGDLTFPEGTLLPAVKCIQYLALNGSTQLPLFEYQMKRLGMWDRVTVQIGEADPEGKAAGCFRAHVRGWNEALARGCPNVLMLEEDVYFNEPVVEMGMAHANNFIAQNDTYDMFFLGYTPQVNFSGPLGILQPFVDPTDMLGSVAVYDDNKDMCVYRLHKWLCTQSYIISAPTMERWKDMTYVNGVTPPFDSFLSNHYDTDNFFTIRTPIAFQRYHQGVKGQSGTGETGSPMETFKMIPGVVYSIYDPELFGKANITSPPECLPPPAAYSYVGLKQTIQGMVNLLPAPLRAPLEGLEKMVPTQQIALIAATMPTLSAAFDPSN